MNRNGGGGGKMRNEENVRLGDRVLGTLGYRKIIILCEIL